MKALYIFIFSTVIFFSSCITIETTSNGFKDEIYYSAEKYSQIAQQEEQELSDFKDQNLERSVSETENEDSYIDEYSSDDYYDYGYSARLRRFHGPSFGFGYYNNYYTNSFWYSNNPYHCGVSIYYGYNFWDPFYYDPFYYSFYPYNYYNPFYHHYHHHHFHHGYHDVYAINYPSYYNSYDNNSLYYGPRDHHKNKTPESFANLYSTHVKNKEPFSQSINQKDKLPQYNVNPSSEMMNKRPVSNLNNSFDQYSNQNSFTKPNRQNQTINQDDHKQPSINKPVHNTKPKPSNTIYSKPSSPKKPAKERNPYKNNYSKTPNYNKSNSSPSFNSSPRSSFPSGGGGKRPR
jgi:hypothetical protein